MRFVEEEALEQHVVSNHRFRCTSCETSFVKEEALEQHVISKHRFQCPNCKMHFGEKDEMEEHNRTHLTDCLVCEGSYIKGFYKQHISMHPLCATCNYIVVDQAALEQHNSSEHHVLMTRLRGLAVGGIKPAARQGRLITGSGGV